MWLSAATATAEGDPTAGKVMLAGIAAVWLLGYLAACWWWPFKACRRCQGRGRFRSPGRKAWRLCRRCKGSGARLRTGRRLINAVRRIDDKAKKGT